jgi:predicted acyl esterase
MVHLKVAGTEQGQRRLNGPQTTGRSYGSLSSAEYEIDVLTNVRIAVRDGVALLADVYRPRGLASFPAIVSASAYPRQIQNSGAPMGFVEAGATDFFVPRGYAHVIVNVRGTGGSEGVYDLLGPTERQDMYDLVEWVAAQPWCTTKVGMTGISYFAMTAFGAAVEQPPHLAAIFSPATTCDLYEACYHGGVLSHFLMSWLHAVSKFSAVADSTWRGTLATVIESILRTPLVHKRFEHFNGEAALSAMKPLLSTRLAHPFDAFSSAASIEHQAKDAFWKNRDVVPLLANVRCPVYLGCDWQNVPLHLPSTFSAYNALPDDIPKRVAMLGEFGLGWPWESLHVEALAWFDQWLKGRDTGIMEGAPIRYVVPAERAERWHETPAWPPPECTQTTFALFADGTLSAHEGASGSRSYVYKSSDYGSIDVAEPGLLEWTTQPLEADVTLVGPVELLLDAASSGGDTAFHAQLQDVAPDGAVVDVTAGWRRAAISDDLTELGVVPMNVQRRYRIKLVDNARCFRQGHRIRLLLRGDDSTPPPPIMGFKHAPVGTATRVTVASSSRLALSILL